jgi:hypothetical protein
MLGIGLGAGLGAGLTLAVVLRRKQGGGKGARAEQEGQQSRLERLEKEEPKYVVTESELQQTFKIPCRQGFLRSKYARAYGLRICLGL